MPSPVTTGILLVLLCPAIARGGDGVPLSDIDALDLFGRAGNLYQQASELPPKQAEEAMKLFQQAADLYEEILTRGFEHPDVYYNLGNACFKLNQVGRAILNYRRAQQFRPADVDLAENLRTAKDRILDKEPDRNPPELLRTLLFWYYDFPTARLAAWALAGYLALCASLCAYVFLRRAYLRYAIHASTVVLAVFGLSFLLKWHRETAEPVAVVLASEAIVRTGFSETEAEKFRVHEGTELLVEEIRNGSDGSRWLKVALDAERRGWIRGDTVDVIQEPPHRKPAYASP
jgi:tetratricopeptide (TPR) repeat protein